MAERLHKVLARMVVGSRREIEGWIRAGRVKIDGKPVELGQTDEGLSQIEIDGSVIKLASKIETEVLLYHKPHDEICSRKDPEGRKTVFERLPDPTSGSWISVGRLDLTTTGILLFTNDGDLANALMHPSASVDREYLVRVHGGLYPDILQNLREGVQLEDGVARFTDVQPRSSKGTNQWVQVVLQEGRNHEVKRMFESQGLQVTRLIRIRFGPIALEDNFRKGRHRLLVKKEVQQLKALILQSKRDISGGE